MGIFAAVLLACAVLLVVAAEWPRLRNRVGADARTARSRRKRKRELTVISGDADATDDFEASVQRDLESLPVIEERDGRSRR